MLKRILNFLLVILKGSSRGESLSKGTGPLTRTGRLQCSKISVHVPLPWKLLKPLIVYGQIPGHAREIADAEQASIQALLAGTPCWICFPLEARTAKMGGFRRPVVKLLRAL